MPPRPVKPTPKPHRRIQVNRLHLARCSTCGHSEEAHLPSRSSRSQQSGFATRCTHREEGPGIRGVGSSTIYCTCTVFTAPQLLAEPAVAKLDAEGRPVINTRGKAMNRRRR